MNEVNSSKLNSFNIATFLVFLNSITPGLLGLLNLSLGTLQPFTEAYIGLTASDIRTFNPELMNFIEYFNRLLGLWQIVFAISLLFVFNYGFRKKEKWAWVFELLVILVFALPFSVLSFSLYGSFVIPAVISGILAILAIFALIISYKDFFK